MKSNNISVAHDDEKITTLNVYAPNIKAACSIAQNT